MFTLIENALLDTWRSRNFSSADEVRRAVTPFDHGVVNGGITIPPATILNGNAMACQYSDRMVLTDLSGVDFWIRCCRGVPLQTLTRDFMKMYVFQSAGKLIPIVRFITFPESRKHEMVPLQELVLLYNLTTVESILRYLLNFITFGVYLNETIARDFLQMADIPSFVAARCFQGAVDKHLVGEDPIASLFFPEFVSRSYSPDNIQSAMENEVADLSSLLRQEQIMMQNSNFVEGSTPQLLAMQEANAINLDVSYQKYLRTPSSLPKVGQNVFLSITQGKRSKAPSYGIPTPNVSTQQEETRRSIPYSSQNPYPEIPYVPLETDVNGSGVYQGLGNLFKAALGVFTNEVNALG